MKTDNSSDAKSVHNSPQHLVDRLKALAICETATQAAAAALLMRASAEILSATLGPEEAAAVIIECVGAGLALSSPAGRA